VGPSVGLTIVGAVLVGVWAKRVDGLRAATPR
jgi:hypothetical protein